MTMHNDTSELPESKQSYSLTGSVDDFYLVADGVGTRTVKGTTTAVDAKLSMVWDDMV